jgi:hypothetical protein
MATGTDRADRGRAPRRGLPGVRARRGGPGTTMTRDRKGLSSDELQAARDDADLQAARDEAKRRIASRDERAARYAAHEERVAPFRDDIQAAINKQDATFPRSEDGELHPLAQQVSKALITALLACNPPPEDDADDAYAPGWAPTPAVGPPTLPELKAVQRRAEGAGYQVLVEELRALCDAAHATGTVDESALAKCDPRIVEALKRERADRADQEAWCTAPSRRAQPRESLDVLTARVLVERGRTQFEATKMVTEMSSDEARDSSIRKKVDRAMKAQAKLAAPPEDEELSPEALAELERVMEESSQLPGPDRADPSIEAVLPGAACLVFVHAGADRGRR